MAPKKSAKEKSAEPKATNGENTILVLPLSNIKADFDWNSRSGKWREGKGDDSEDSGASFEELRLSIASHGQDTPVDVRLVKGKYHLTTGFRRFAAIEANAKEAGDKAPTIRCILRDDDDAEARMRNIRENIDRQNLRGPDIAFAIFDLWKLNKEKNIDLKSAALGQLIGRSQEYANRCMNIMQQVKHRDILDKWRSMPKSIPMLTMLNHVGKVNSDRQHEAFEALCKAKSKGDGDSPDPDAWKAAAKESAKKLGATLAEFEFHDLCEVNEDSFKKENARILGKVPSTIEEKKLDSASREIAKSAHEGYLKRKDALLHPPVKKDGEPEKKRRSSKNRSADEAEAAESN